MGGLRNNHCHSQAHLPVLLSSLLYLGRHLSPRVILCRCLFLVVCRSLRFFGRYVQRCWRFTQLPVLCRCRGACFLQLQAPNVTYRAAFDDLPYCNQTSLTNLYKTPNMDYAYYQGPCVNYDEKQVVYPPDEANAMFITSRLTETKVYRPPSTLPHCTARV